MKLNVKTIEANYLEIEFEGEDYAIPNALREILISNKDVEFVACKVDHPQVGQPILILRTKSKNPLDLLSAAVDELKEQASELKDALKTSKKAKGK
ncbi:MAG: DNA-directed RNA polymerase subunit L [Candidatus Micrarchaeota archaeon]